MIIIGIPILLILFVEQLFRLKSPNNSYRPSTLIYTISSILANYAKILGGWCAKILDYHIYLDFLRHALDRIVDFLKFCDKWLRIIFKRVYDYLPIQDLINLALSVLSIFKVFASFGLGYKEYYNKLMQVSYQYGLSRKIVAAIVILTGTASIISLTIRTFNIDPIFVELVALVLSYLGVMFVATVLTFIITLCVVLLNKL